MKFLRLALLFVILSVSQISVFASGQVFYVSKLGNNLDGLSWDTAWNELDQIRWKQIQPGATIYIDGGISPMVYETQLSYGSNGTADAPIVIRASNETNRRGQIIFFGGRTQNLPYCGQTPYNNQSASTMRDYGIRSNGYDYISLNGGRWPGILIQGYRVNGIRLHPDSQNLSFEYLEITNNGDAMPNSWNGGWSSDHAGVRIAGANMLFRRVIIHDNGQDAFQSLYGANGISNFRLQKSWLYNGRKHPTVNESWNYCRHTDGIQIYDGGVVVGITVTESIFGPGFTQNVLLGQTPTSSGSWADVRDVTFRDVVFSRGADNGVAGYRDTNSSNWMLDRVTIDCRETKSHCIRIFNANHSVRNSIIVDGMITFPDGLNHYYNNCQWNTSGFELGQVTNPFFVNVSTSDMFSFDNYEVDSDSPCVGSRTTSAAQIMGQ